MGAEPYELPIPHHCYLQDGRLLCWYHAEASDRVEGFRIGRETVALAEGLALLAAERRQHNGRLLGPVVEPPVSAAGRRSRGRRSR